MRTCPHLFAALAVSAALAAPSRGEALRPQDSWAGTMEEREGAIWVTNPATPLWPDDGRPRMEFELEQVFGADEAPEEALLGSAPWITVDDAGRVYVVDGKATDLVAFDPNGTVLWRKSGPGQGPADIEGLRDIAWDGAQTLMLLNQSGTRLDTWHIDGTYLDSFRLAEVSITKADKVSFVGPNTLRLAARGPGETLGYTLVDGPAWRLEHSASLSTSWTDRVPPLSRAFADIAIAGDLIVLGNVFAHEFNLFSVDGAPVRRVMRPASGFVPSVSEGMQYYRNFGHLYAPIRLSDGKWLTSTSWTSNVTDPVAAVRRERQGEKIPRERHYEIELYDPEGRWLTSMTWEHPDVPPFGRPSLVGPDGRLYSTSVNPFPQVRRYRLVLRPPADAPAADQ